MLTFSELVWKRNKYVPGLGSFHLSDLQEFFNFTGSSDWVGADAVSTCLFAFHVALNVKRPFSVNFAHALDPNAPQGGYPLGGVSSLLSGLNWQKWTPSCPELLTLEDPDVLTFSNDTFREEVVAYLNCLSDQMGL